MTARDTARWIVRLRPRPDASLRLFCFPYAGASAPLFQSWPAALPTGIEVCAIALPGRGRRFNEPNCQGVLPLVRSIADHIEPFLDRPFALFGHSMGAFLAFELARHLRREIAVHPTHLAVSGAGAPQLARRRYHTLSEERFLEELRALNGIDPAVLRDPELMTLLLPVIRADFATTETYVCGEESPLACPISVFGGTRDPLVASDRLQPWAVHTTAGCRVDLLPGDHFFLHTAEAELLALLAGRLALPDAVSHGAAQ